MFKMLHISPTNHAMIISWKFHPNSISFERVSKLSHRLPSWWCPWLRIFASWRLFLAQKFFNIFFPRNCPQKCLQKNGFRKNKFVTSYFRRNGINFIFWWFFGPFWPPGPKLRIFGKKRSLHVVSPYWPLTSCQKSEKSLEPILRKVWKTSKMAYFWPFGPIFPKMGFFSKKRASSLFY